MRLVTPIRRLIALSICMLVLSGSARANYTTVVDTASYNLKRATSLAGPFTVLTNLVTTNFTDYSATPGAPSYYVVSATNGVGESANSNPASATPLSPPALEARFASDTGAITLTWPAWATNFSLQSAAQLDAPIQWQPVTDPIGQTSNQFFLVLPAPGTGARQFYQLRAP